MSSEERFLFPESWRISSPESYILGTLFIVLSIVLWLTASLNHLPTVTAPATIRIIYPSINSYDGGIFPLFDSEYANK